MIKRKSCGLSGGGVTYRYLLSAVFFGVSMLTFTVSAKNIYITPDGTGNGTSWESPISLATYFANNGADRNGHVLYIKSGQYSVSLADPVTCGAYHKITIRGGYAGTDNETLDPYFPYSEINFNSSVSYGFRCSGKASYPVVMERLKLSGCNNTAVYKTGAGSLTLTDCMVVSNGWRNASGANKNGGRGIHVENGSFTASKCIFAYNGMYFGSGSAGTYSDNGYGLYVSGNTVKLQDCKFIGNGAKITEEAPTASIRDAGKGMAIFANNATVTAKGCDFICNRAALGVYGSGETGGKGGIVVMSGTSSGTFENCSWIANQNLRDTTYGGDISYGGVLTLDMASSENVVTVDKCTFAYNITDSSTAASGIDVRKGTLNLKNSVFAGNKKQDGNALGSDLVVRAAGIVNAVNCLFPSIGGDSITVEDGGSLAMSGTVVGDAALATDVETAHSCIKTRTGKPYLVYDPASLDKVLAFDVHLRSRRGRWTGDGYVRDRKGSPAIDAGLADADVGDEPRPNGSRLNLGRYAGTEEASLSGDVGFRVYVR